FRIWARNAERARHCELQTAAEGISIDRCNGRYREAVELREDGLALLGPALLRHQIAPPQLLDVGAGAECFLASACDDQRADRHFRGLVDGAGDILNDGERECVERLLPIEGHDRELFTLSQLDGHARFSSRAR